MTSCSNDSELSENFESELSDNSSLKELLEKLVLPEGVSEEILAEIIAACILKKAYLTQSAWSKWILLAGLEELFGRSAPLISEQEIRELQEDSMKFSSNDSIEVNLQSCLNSVEEVNIQNSEILKEDNTPDKSLDVSVPNVDLTKHSITDTASSCSYSTDHNNNRNLPNLRRNCSKKTFNVGTQCNPRKLGILLNQKTQTNNSDIKKSILVNNSSTKTDNVSVLLQSYSSLYGREMVDSYIQTDVISLKDNFSQTSQTCNLEKISAQKWNLQKISDLSHRRTQIMGNKKTTLNVYGKSIKMFYDKPLIDSKSKSTPRLIPLNPIPIFTNGHISFDPRIGNSFVDDNRGGGSSETNCNGSLSDCDSYENICYSSGLSVEMTSKDASSAYSCSSSSTLNDFSTNSKTIDMEIDFS